MVFVRAKTGPANAGDPVGKFTVHYFDEKGNLTIRSGGSRTWRCNNPGALLESPYSMSEKRRAIGKAGYGDFFYAVYPDYNAGHEALVVMLRGGVYSKLTLKEASTRYVRQDPDHIHKIMRLANHSLDPNRILGSLNDKEFEIYWKAIEKNENWEVGTEHFIEKWYISGVRRKRGVITDFCVKQHNQEKWVCKTEAISLARKYQLHVTVVHMKNGNCYLRPEHRLKAFLTIV